MAFLPQTQVTNVEEILANASSGSLPHIPDGEYTGLFVKSEMKQAQSGGQFLELTLVITQGQYKDTEFTERLNLVNNNQTAVKIAYETLARIAKAVGLSTIPQDSNALHNKPFSFKAKTEKGTEFTDKKTGEKRQGKDKSVIDSNSYKALPQVGASNHVQAAVAGVPWAK